MSLAIIIPAYNAAAYLREAVASALEQDAPDRNVTVVDDGSTDASARIAQSFGDAVALIRQENGGVSSARNRGAAAATARWLLFLDADDRLRPHAASRLLARAESNSDFGVVYGQTFAFDESSDATFVRGDAALEGQIPTASRIGFWKSAISTPGAAIIRRDVFEAVGGFDQRWNTAADRDFWMKAGALTQFGFVPEPVVERRLHGANMSGNLDRARRQAAEVQLSFLVWLRNRKIDDAYLGVTETEIIERNLARALELRSFEAARWICDEAVRRQIQTKAVASAQGLLGWPAPLRRARLAVREKLRRLLRHG